MSECPFWGGTTQRPLSGRRFPCAVVAAYQCPDHRSRTHKCCHNFQRARRRAAEKRLVDIAKIMAGWSWHGGRIEGRTVKAGSGAYMTEAIHLREFRELRILVPPAALGLEAGK